MTSKGATHPTHEPSGIEPLETRTLMSAVGGPEALGGIVIDAGGTIASAANLGVFAGPRVRAASQQVGPADTADVFKFRVTRPMLVTLTLGGYTQDLDIQLMRLNGRELGVSETAHPRESVSRILQPGWYAVKVEPYQPQDGASGYTLRVRTQNLPTAPGSTVATATPFATFRGLSFHEVANDAATDADHWYKFRVTKRMNFYVDLETLSADLDLSLHRMNGQRLALSENTGSESETIRRVLTPGWYAIRVNPFNENRSTYALRVQATPPPVLPTDPASIAWAAQAHERLAPSEEPGQASDDDVLDETYLPALLTLQ